MEPKFAKRLTSKRRSQLYLASKALHTVLTEDEQHPPDQQALSQEWRLIAEALRQHLRTQAPSQEIESAI